MGEDNIEDGISLVQVADGALNEVTNMLQRMNVLSVQAANGTNSDSDRRAIQDEVDQLMTEIDRIGETTSFNNKYLFHPNGEGSYVTRTITTLIGSVSADNGHFCEAFAYNGGYYPAASIDFSNITAEDIELLEGQGFSFNCSAGCDEVFDIKFTMGASSASNLNGRVTHKYKINIADCSSGADIVNKVYEYVSQNLPAKLETANAPTGLLVSHTNAMVKNGNKLIIYGIRDRQATEQAAINKYKDFVGVNAGVSCSSIVTLRERNATKNDLRIQCSGEAEDGERLCTYEMSTATLGINELSVMTERQATKAIRKVDYALALISAQRSELGAYQNRLEYAHSINKNTSENTTSAESVIRDTDMAEEMMTYSKYSILDQVSESMLSQANSSKDSVLSLLQAT